MVDVRMIDFAQCVVDVTSLDPNPDIVPFPPTTNGADVGYLLGLETLIAAFESIDAAAATAALPDG
jgi:hypothetical protein